MLGVCLLAFFAGLTFACDHAPPGPDSRERAFYSVALETKTVCEQLVEECLRNWRGQDWGDPGGCTKFLLGDGEARQIHGRALLSVLDELEGKIAPEIGADGDLANALRDLYQESSAICDLVDKRGRSYSDIQREFYRKRDRFNSAQRAVLEHMPMTTVEANKLYDRWQARVDKAEKALLARPQAAGNDTSSAVPKNWGEFLAQVRLERGPGRGATRGVEVSTNGLRRLSPAEHAAAELALAYLADGPAAWWNRLAPESWLERLGKETALREIEARAGPYLGSRWELQVLVGTGRRDSVVFAIELPSGLEEVLELRLIEVGSSWRIRSVRSWIDRLPSETSRETAGAADSPEPIGELLPLRRALARDPQPEVVQRIVSGLGNRPRLEAVATIWQAQLALRNGDLNAAESLLARLPLPAQRPLTDVLRGRLSLLRGEEIASAAAFERVVGAAEASEGLVIEAAEAMDLMGLPRESEGLLRRVAASGSGKAQVYYELARAATVDRDEEGAAKLFAIGWTLEPMERAEVLRDPILSYLVRSAGLLGLLEVEKAEDPAPRPDDLGVSPIGRPGLATSRFHGRHLRLEVGGSVLSIPGGVRLAPSDSRPQDPRRRRLTEERRILEDLEALEHNGGEARALIRPRLREEVTLAARTLARHNRWQDLVTLTEKAAARPELVPSDLASLRAEALIRLDRATEAQRLLVDVVKSRAKQKRKDPQPLYELGLLLANRGHFEEAERVVAAAERQSLEVPVHSLLPRIRLEDLLSRSFLTRRSKHFEIRYPPGTEDYFVERLAEVLEQELERLQKWIPWKPSDRIEVQLYDFDEFFRAFAPNRNVLGLYDGKVRAPLANLPTLHPRVLGILTHELAHALVAGATSNQAPHWFHEGLAQHVEPIQAQVNPIGDYKKLGTFLSFPLLEPVLTTSTEPYLTNLGYDEAVWVVHYLESRHGRRGIRKMVDAFARGETTEEALSEVLGVSMTEFDEDVWTWCLEDAPAAWPVETVRYDLGPPEGIELSRRSKSEHR